MLEAKSAPTLNGGSATGLERHGVDAMTRCPKKGCIKLVAIQTDSSKFGHVTLV